MKGTRDVWRPKWGCLVDGAEAAAAEEVVVGEAAGGGLEDGQVDEEAPLVPLLGGAPRRAGRVARSAAAGPPPARAAPAGPRPRPRRGRHPHHLTSRGAWSQPEGGEANKQKAGAAEHMYTTHTYLTCCCCVLPSRAAPPQTGHAGGEESADRPTDGWVARHGVRDRRAGRTVSGPAVLRKTHNTCAVVCPCGFCRGQAAQPNRGVSYVVCAGGLRDRKFGIY